ncbi:MAG: hypothetical protein AUK31_03185 [Fibrobacteres bacterium CG2_30_45_31]|nr:MAG: hypothetical protein AUK31_03185 [Fibrobacteres bacterium CG2_30_45_31]
MMKTMLLVVITGAMIILSGCKGTNEKRGDEHLKEGRYRNAINSYLEAKNNGNVSTDFYDNFCLALVKAAEMESKKDPNSSLLSGYFSQTMKNLDKVVKPETAQEIAISMATVGKSQAAVDADLGTTLDGFAKIDSALAVVKRTGGAEAPIKAIRTEAENAYVARVMPEVLQEEDVVVREYHLLKIALIAPENEQLKRELNKSHIATRGYFLIFGENLGEKASPLVDKWGYVMGFPSINITSTGLTGEIQFWASTGNNTELEVEKIKLVSTRGDEVLAKQVGNGWCEAEVIVGKKENAKIEKKKTPFKGKGKLMNEFQCSANVSFTFQQGFIPDYVEYKDQYGWGRKYLGQ